MSLGSLARIWRSPNVFMPNQTLVGCRMPFSSGRTVMRTGRCVTSRMAATREPFMEDMAMCCVSGRRRIGIA